MAGAAGRDAKILLSTEGCSCPGVRRGDWLRAERLGHDVIYDLLNHAQGWIDWNLLLDASGGPNHQGNQCDASLVAAADFSAVQLQPKFFYLGHLSKFVVPGSVRVDAALVGDFGYAATDPNIQAGVELGAFRCERSARQVWRLAPHRAGRGARSSLRIELAAPAATTNSFTAASDVEDAGPVVTEQLCVASGDANRPFLRLAGCNDSGVLSVAWRSDFQLADTASGLCVGLAGGSTEPGALLSLGPCAARSVELHAQVGELRLGGSLCLTAGWPFLSAVAFVTPTNSVVAVVMNEAATDISVNVRIAGAEQGGGAFSGTVARARSIQTLVFESR